MAGTVRTYSPDKVKIIVGVLALTGFADGTFVSVEQMTDGVTSQAGADGEVARAMSADKRMRVTITLQQTSASNDFLSAAYLADQASGGDIPLPIAITDLRGCSLFFASSAWVVKMPTAEFGKEIGTREWVLETAAADFNVGGN